MNSKAKLKKLVSLVLCLMLVFPAALSAQASIDYEGHWSQESIKVLFEKGFVTGYTDGSFKPDREISRAEFMAIVNRAFDFNKKAEFSFKDVKEGEWYYEHIARAVEAGYIKGFTDGTMRPAQNITRQEAAVIIARILDLEKDADIKVIASLKDADKIPEWSAKGISAVITKGYINKNEDGNFEFAKPITRAEMAFAVEKSYVKGIKKLYAEPGIFTAGNIDGSVKIDNKDITLTDTVINGDLILGEDIGDGNVHLVNVTVKGDTVVKGGGKNSIIIENCQFSRLIIIKEGNRVRVLATGNTVINETQLQSGAILEQQNLTAEGFGYVTIAEGLEGDALVELIGNFESVEIRAEGIQLQASGGTIGNLLVDQGATNVNIELASKSNVTNLITNSPTTVTGTGNIQTAQVNTDGTKIEAPVTKVETAPGVEVDANIAKPTVGGGGGIRKTSVSTISVKGTGDATTISENGGTLQMIATVSPKNASNKSVTWSVTNGTGSATISATGLLTAVTNGTVTVKATAKDGSGVSGTKEITISGQLDVSAINTAIAAANAAKADVVISEDGTDVAPGTYWATQAVNDALDTAIAVAQAVADKADATQGEVDDAVTDLRTATTTFNNAKQDGMKAVVPDAINFKTPAESFLTGYTRPSALYDGTNYHLWYRTYGATPKLAYHRTAENIEGLKTATANDIKLGETTWEGLDNLSIIKEADKYYMFSSSSDGIAINVYESEDGFNWGSTPTTVLNTSTVGDWAKTKIDNPMVIYDGTEYKLYYQGKSDSSGYQIGLATSNSLTGSYTAVAEPVLKLGTSGEWDVKTVSQPWVVKDSDFYYMWYAAGDGPKAIGYAWSTDGINWIKTDNAVIASAELWQGKPTVVKVGNDWHLWFLHEKDYINADIMYVNSIDSKPVTVTGISVKTAPDKVTYTVGETLDLTGLEVTLTKSDSSKEDVAFADFASKGITASPANGAPLATTNTKVTLTHTESSKSVEQTITVNAAASSINWLSPQIAITNAVRPTALHDGTDYHIWYVESKTIKHKFGGTPFSMASSNADQCKLGSEDINTTTFGDNPFVIKEDTTYYMFISNPDGSAINVYSSVDGTNWTLAKESVLNNGSGDNWDADKIDNPMVIHDGTGYKLYYQGYRIVEGVRQYKIGVATCDSIAGSYTKSERNPIIQPATPEAWDSGRVFQPWVVKDGTYCYMWYAGSLGAAGPQGIGFAYSLDGINWTKADSNPILKADGVADKQPTAVPTVVKVDDNWHMWYLCGENINYISTVKATPEVNFTFTGLESVTANEEFEFAVTSKIANNGAVDSSTDKLRFKAELKKGDVAVSDIEINYTEGEGTPFAASFTTNADGIAYFGPADGILPVGVQALIDLGVTTPFKTTLADAGEYTLTLSLVDIEEGNINVGEAATETFTVASQETPAAPEIVSAVAHEGGSSEPGLGANDTLTITFNVDTNQSGTLKDKAAVDAVINWGEKSFGTEYSGIWRDAKTLEIRAINAADATFVVSDSITIKQSASIKTADGLSAASTSTIISTGDFYEYPPARIVGVSPSKLKETPENDGSLRSEIDFLIITLEFGTGTFVDSIYKSDVTASNLPTGLDYNVAKRSQNQLTITFTGNAQNHGSANDVNNITFTISKDKVNRAESDLTTPDIGIRFVDTVSILPIISNVTEAGFEMAFNLASFTFYNSKYDPVTINGLQASDLELKNDGGTPVEISSISTADGGKNYTVNAKLTWGETYVFKITGNESLNERFSFTTIGIVAKTTPITDQAVSATGVIKGQTLSDSILTGTFKHPMPRSMGPWHGMLLTQ